MRPDGLNEKKYYQYLDTLGENKNKCGFVAHHVPFKNAGDAVKYIMEMWPDDQYYNDPIEYSPSECKKHIDSLYYETDYLLHRINKLKEEARVALSAMTEERDSMPNKNILQNVHKELLQERINQAIGYYTALCNVWMLLNERKWEFRQLAYLKEE